MRRAVVLAVAGALAVALEASLARDVPFLPVAPDLALILAVYLGLHEHSPMGAVGAFLLGYLIDTYTGPAPGLNCLTTTLVFGVIYLLSRRLWMENPASNVAAVALGELVKIAIAVLYFALLHRQEVPWWSVGRVLGLEALLALVCAPFVFGLLDAQLNAYRTGRRARATATK
ncbi:MAG: rod shape-determining protein MreD [Deltaproteobacteria bacterium]